MSAQNQPDRKPDLDLLIPALALCCVAVILWLYVTSVEHAPVAWLIGIKLLPLLAPALLLVCGGGLGGVVFWGGRRRVARTPGSVMGCGLLYGTLALAALPWRLAPFFAAMGFILGLAGLQYLLRGEDKELSEPLGSWSGLPGWFFAVLVIFGIMSLLCAFTPPWEYDEQEYHLGSVAYFLLHHDSWIVPGNVYSYFPQNVEMWFLTLQRMAQSLSPDSLDGIYAGKLINVLFGILIALLVGWIAKRCAKAPEGETPANDPSGYAAVFFYCSPTVIAFSAVAYVEMALTFYLILSLCLFLIYTTVEPGDARRRVRYAGVCGVMCGFAAGCKYTGILFAVVPLAAFILVENLKRCTASALRQGARDLGIFLFAAILFFSPWLIRNLVTTGNPVFPLLYSVLGGRGWDAAHAAMFAKAHAPGPMTLAALGGGLWEALTNSALTSVLTFLFIPLLIFRPRAITAPARWVLAYGVVCCVLWLFFTHRVDRFLAPVFPAFAVLSALGFWAWQEGWMGKALKGVVAVCLAFALYQGLIIGSNLGAFTVALHPGERERFFRENTDFYEVYQALQFLNKKVPKPVRFDRVLFLAEVRAFYCKADWLAPTVFNVNPLETALRECERPDKAAWRLRGQGFSHLLVNWAEFQRLRRTYGAFEDFDFKKWEAFRDACLEPLASFGPKDKAGECPIVVYAIKKEGQADRPAAR